MHSPVYFDSALIRPVSILPWCSTVCRLTSFLKHEQFCLDKIHGTCKNREFRLKSLPDPSHASNRSHDFSFCRFGVSAMISGDYISIKRSIDRDDKSIIAARWREAVKNCENNVLRISRTDFETLQGFSSFDALVHDLRRREIELQGKKSWMSQCTL
jgi:ATP-dependent helicase YprA (DUF1998 family)